MQKIIITTLIIISVSSCYGQILINEISAGGSTDWVEIKVSEDVSAIDISGLFVTMYYGSNEKIAGSPVTLRGKDIPETPYDDRFAVIHFSSSGGTDETDAAGDINGNGVRDLYCNNYGLWNTDCVVSIDTDDDPANGGIIDFAAFSNRDGSVNSTIAGYMKYASDSGEWITCSSANPQDCMTYIGENGMNSYSTLSRKKAADTNSPDDFILTQYSTPGRDNIVNHIHGNKKTAEPLSDRIIYRPDREQGIIPVKILVHKKCSVKIRIFNAAGSGIYSSDLLRELTPGFHTLNIRASELKGKLLTGLYPVKLEFYAEGRSDKSTIYLVLLRR